MFQEHSGDVMSVSLSSNDVNLFVSGSCDATAKVWDVRLAKSVRTFAGLHESDINSVQFFPKDECFGTGSDDSSCRLFDMRTFRQLNHFFSDKVCYYDNCYSWLNHVLCVYFLHIAQCLSKYCILFVRLTDFCVLLFVSPSDSLRYHISSILRFRSYAVRRVRRFQLSDLGHAHRFATRHTQSTTRKPSLVFRSHLRRTCALHRLVGHHTQGVLSKNNEHNRYGHI